MEQLKDFIRSKIDINDLTLEAILSTFKERTIAKGKLALKRGHIATDYFFVKSGGLRIYYIAKNREITAWVALENAFFTDLSSLRHQSPSRFNIEAIEDTILLTIRHDKMEQLYSRYPQWQQFTRQVWEDTIQGVIEEIVKYQSMSGEERYLNEVRQSEFLRRIPLKQLASYLGITPTSLSRLRKNLR